LGEWVPCLEVQPAKKNVSEPTIHRDLKDSSFTMKEPSRPKGRVVDCVHEPAIALRWNWDLALKLGAVEPTVNPASSAIALLV
jgi:hypothetical protein